MSRFFPLNKSPRELSTADLLALKGITEGWYCEYKEQMLPSAKIAKAVSAFANSYGGWIFFGIVGDKESRCAICAPGIPNANIGQAETSLRQAVSGAISPAPYYEHAVLQGPLPEMGLSEDHTVLAVYVPQGQNAPYLHSNGRIYRRVADESHTKEETDRHLLDLLFRRSKNQRKRIKEAISKRPETSETEKAAPYLRLLIFTDLWREGGKEGLTFSRFKEVMKDGNPAFDNFYTTPFGCIARITFGNKPANIIYSWHHRGWYEEIIYRFSWFTVPKTGLPYPEYQGFQHGDRFLHACRSSKLEARPVVEMSTLFSSVLMISQKLEIMLDEQQVPSDLYFKVQLSGIWRVVPFIDIGGYLSFIKLNGIPITQEKVAYGPAGRDADTLASLRAWRREAVEHEDDTADSPGRAVVLNAITIYKEILKCFGIPLEELGLNVRSVEEIDIVFTELLGAANRSHSIGLRHLGLTSAREDSQRPT